MRTAANEGNEEITSRAARDTANALRDYAAAVRGVAATSRDKDSQNRLIEQAHLVMNKSATLVLEAQRAMANPADPNKSSKLSAASNDVLTALGYAMDVMPGQEGVCDFFAESTEHLEDSLAEPHAHPPLGQY